MEAFTETEGGYFHNVRQLLLILAVLPVMTSKSERSFSSLKRIKSYLRTQARAQGGVLGFNPPIVICVVHLILYAINYKIHYIQ